VRGLHRPHPSIRMPRVAPATTHPGRQVFAADPGGPWVIILSILFWLIFYINLPSSLDGYAGAGTGISDSSDGNRFFKIAMIALSVFALVARWPKTRAVIGNTNVGLAGLLVLCPLSAAWSIDPSATIMRYVSLGAIVLVCFALASCGWQRRSLQQLTIPPLLFILAGSLIVGILYPDRIAEAGTDLSQKDAWHGITHGKNEFGMIAAMGVIIFANGVLARDGRVLGSLVGAAISFTCLILSRSHTSLFSAFVGVGFMVLVMWVPMVRQRFSAMVAGSMAGLIVLYQLVIQNVLPGVNTLLAPIMSLTGKDTTFSSRTIIWQVVKEHIQGAPYLGTGYGAYWVGPLQSSPSYVFVPMMNFYPTEAHNGYLDIMNDLGLVGLLFLSLFVVWYLRQGLQLMRYDRAQAALYLALLFQEMVIDMSESDFFSRTSTFAILLLASTNLSRALVELRTNSQPVARSDAQPVRAGAA
jgi:exopolysaccharide production protein ExoQ